MNPPFEPVCATQAPCKCCGAPASLYGVVDFHKNCAVPGRKILDLSGIPIYYYRCPHCRFIFTTAFDRFSKDDFHRHIYNEEYLALDPDYQQIRPRGNADMLGRLFAGAKPRRILDYGGGNGLLAELLRAGEFPETDTYDPFSPRFSAKPPHRYDCIVSFEVAEHAIDPLAAFAEMNDLLADSGIIIFSTLLQPATIDQEGLNWWYALPRNGHVSLYSKASLEIIVRRHQFKFGSFNGSLHVLFRDVPDFAKHFIRVG